MVKSGHDEDVVVARIISHAGLLSSRYQRPQRRMDGRQVIHSASSDELLSGAKHRTALGVGSNEIEGSDVFWANAELLADDPQDRRLRCSYGQHRLHVALAVRLELILAVKVDCQGRQAQQRPRIDEVASAVLRHDLTTNGQLTVEPAVEEYAAIDFHGHLLPPCRIEIRGRLQGQARGIGMGTDDPETRVRASALRNVPSHDGSAAHHHVPTWRCRPLISLLLAAKSNVD